MNKNSLIFALTIGLAMSGCASGGNDTATEETTEANETTKTTSNTISKEDITVDETYENSADGEHAISVEGEEKTYENIQVNKTGNASGDEADFYGENAAVFATEKGTLTISKAIIETDGEHANGVFSYGEGTTVTISDSVIETSGNCSGGLMTTGGGTMIASNLNIHTTGNSSAAIRSDRGGGDVYVTGGNYVTDGKGSPVIYSTANINVEDAYLESTASQGVVVEGKNSVTLTNVDLVADNNTHNSDKSDIYEAVMIYQSMSGDAASGTSSFTMEGGTLTNENGDIFFVNNTACEINLTDVSITNNDENGNFLTAKAAGWGKEGSNGGKVNMTLTDQKQTGDITVDDISVLNLYLNNSTYEGAINTEGQAGQVYVELDEGSTWKLTGDSYITGLTCDTDAIDLNGYTLYVNGEKYEEGSKSEGTAVEIVTESEGGMEPGDMEGHGPGDGSEPPEKPDGNEPPEKPDGNEPPEKPDGNKPPEKPDGNEPPEKPSESKTDSSTEA